MSESIGIALALAVCLWGGFRLGRRDAFDTIKNRCRRLSFSSGIDWRQVEEEIEMVRKKGFLS